MATRVVVLGATGFLGSHLVQRLMAEGHEVVSVGRRDAPHPGAIQVQADLFQPEALHGLLDGAYACMHLATDLVPSSAELAGFAGLERNLALANRVADACVRSAVRTLVFASSGGTVYGADVPAAHEDDPCRPIGLYGVQKLANEALLRSRLRGSVCKLRVLRIGNPYGSGQERQRAHGVIGHMLDALIHGRPFKVWGDGTQVRDYVTIRDVEGAFLKAMEYSGPDDVFNVGSGCGTSTNELIGICQEVAQRQLEVSYGTHPAHDVDRIFLNIDRAGRELGWRPSESLLEGITRYYLELSEIMKDEQHA